MADSSKNEIPVENLAAEDLAIEAAKAWKSIGELRRAYREANEKIGPAQSEYNQALQDRSAGGVARRFAAKNTLRDLISNQNSAYQALLAGKKRFNDIQQRRVAVAGGGGSRTGGDSSESVNNTSVAGGTGKVVKNLYSWLRRTTSGYYKEGKFVLHAMRKGMANKTASKGAYDFMSAAFGSREAMWGSKLFGRISGLVSGNPAAVAGSVIGLISDAINNVADKGREATDRGMYYKGESALTGLRPEVVQRIHFLGDMYGTKEGRGGEALYGDLKRLQDELVGFERGRAVPMLDRFSEAMLGKFDYSRFANRPSQQLEDVLKAMMEAYAKSDDVSRTLAVKGYSPAFALMMQEGLKNFEYSKKIIGQGENVDLEKAYQEARKVRDQQAKTSRTKEADVFRHMDIKAETVILQEKGKQLIHKTDAIGASLTAGGVAKKAIEEATKTPTRISLTRVGLGLLSGGISGAMTSVGMMQIEKAKRHVIPSTVPVEAESKASVARERPVSNNFNGDINVTTTASTLEGVTKDAVTQGLANAFPNARK